MKLMSETEWAQYEEQHAAKWARRRIEIAKRDAKAPVVIGGPCTWPRRRACGPVETCPCGDCAELRINAHLDR